MYLDKDKYIWAWKLSRYFAILFGIFPIIGENFAECFTVRSCEFKTTVDLTLNITIKQFSYVLQTSVNGLRKFRKLTVFWCFFAGKMFLLYLLKHFSNRVSPERNLLPENTCCPLRSEHFHGNLSCKHTEATKKNLKKN